MNEDLLGVEITDDFKLGIKENLEKVFEIIDKREFLLYFYNDLLSHYTYVVDGAEKEIEDVRRFILNTAMVNIEKTRERACLFAEQVAQRFNLGEINIHHDLEVIDGNEYMIADCKKLKDLVKSDKLQARSESRRVMKTAKALLGIKSSDYSRDYNEDAGERYLQSFNFKYVAELNGIFADSSDYSQVADSLVSVVSKNNVIKNQTEPGDEE